MFALLSAAFIGLLPFYLRSRLKLSFLLVISGSLIWADDYFFLNYFLIINVIAWKLLIKFK